MSPSVRRPGRPSGDFQPDQEGVPPGMRLIARLRVTTMVTTAVEDWTTKSTFTLCDSGIVSVGLKAMMFVYAVKR